MKHLLFLLFSIATFGQVSTGQETPFDYGIQNTAAQLVGNSDYVVTQGNDGTYGKYIFNLNNIDKKQYLSTGLIKNGAISINADPTKYNISAGIGVITNYDNPESPTCTIVNFAAITGKTPTYLTTGNITYIAINSSGAVVEQANAFTTTQRRDLIILGAVIHSNLTTINVVNNISAPTNSDTNQLHDLMSYIGALNLTGNKYTANGANLSLDKSAGSIFKPGVNFANDWKKPHELDEALQTLLTFRYRLSGGTEGSDTTVLNPAVYESGGVYIAVPSNKFTIQTVTMFQTGLTRIQPGQNIYNSLAEAENAILTRAFVVESNIAMNGITRAYIILRNSTTSLQNVSDAKIIEAQKFGGVASGGVALTDTAIIAALGYTPANDIDVVHKTGTEIIPGEKTFTAGIKVYNTLLTDENVSILPGEIRISKYAIEDPAIIKADNLTDARTFQFPDTSGTVALTSNLTSYQPLLVSGTNIKTINGTSLLGSGDISISGGGGDMTTNTSQVVTGAKSFRDGKLILDPNNIAAEKVNLSARTGLSIPFPVPYFTPTQNDTPIAFDVFPKGNASNAYSGSPDLGVAWVDICGTDIVADGVNYESLRLGFFKNGYANVTTAKGGTGTLRPLVLQINGAPLGIGVTNPANDLQVGSTSTGGATTTPKTISIGNSYSSTPGLYPKLKIYDDGSTVFGIGVTANAMEFITVANKSYDFYSAGVKKASISSTGGFVSGAPIRLKNYTVATLPTGVQGDTAYVTDATAPTYLGVLIGGGSIVTPVFYNGTAWVSH